MEGRKISLIGHARKANAAVNGQFISKLSFMYHVVN